MSIEQQLIALRMVLKEKTSVIYDKNFMLKLTIASSSDPTWYEEKLAQVDILIRLFDESIMGRNPRRAMGFLCVISNTISDLNQFVDCFSKDFEQRSLLV